MRAAALRLLASLLLAALAAGCGGGGGGGTAAPTPVDPVLRDDDAVLDRGERLAAVRRTRPR